MVVRCLLYIHVPVDMGCILRCSKVVPNSDILTSRATTAATVSQWYFHRHTIPPNTPSKAIVLAAVSHTFSALLGTTCLSSFISLVCRVPLLIFPRRITWWFQWFFFLIIPGPLVNLVLPLTLTHAAIRSIPLVVAARNNSRLRVLDTERGHLFTSYRMAKMIL